MNDQLADKYGIDEKPKDSANVLNSICWLTMKRPKKEDMKRLGLILKNV